MADFKTNYIKAMKEFEQVTAQRAPVLKGKGKEEGVNKLKDIFKKTAKPLETLCEQFDLSAVEYSKGLSKETVLKKAKALEVAYDNLNEGLKKNIKEMEDQVLKLGRDDKELKVGFEVLIKRLDQFRKAGKQEVLLKNEGAQKLAGKEISTDAKVQNQIKLAYLTIKKGCDESEALMKVFIAKPTIDNLKNAFVSSTGPRSISVAMTQWKIVLKVDPSLNDRLPFDPEHLLTKIFDLTQKKSIDFWEAKLKMDQAGWEDRAKDVALEFLKLLPLWRQIATGMKALVK